MDDEKNGKAGDKVETLVPKPFLRTVEPGKTTAARAEEPPLWPSFTDPYKAAGTADNDGLTALVAVLGKDAAKPGSFAYRIFQYVHIDEGGGGITPGGEQWFVFLFSGRRPKVLTVYGRNVQRICDYIARHRMPWIRVADRDFRPGDGADGDTPIITRITIEEMTEEQEEE
jgi:hypothetical protein